LVAHIAELDLFNLAQVFEVEVVLLLEPQLAQRVCLIGVKLGREVNDLGHLLSKVERVCLLLRLVKPLELFVGDVYILPTLLSLHLGGVIPLLRNLQLSDFCIALLDHLLNLIMDCTAHGDFLLRLTCPPSLAWIHERG